MPKQRRRPRDDLPTLTPPTVSADRASESVGPEPSQRRVVILGAGADTVYGIPTITDLARELANFSLNEGGPIQRVLRQKLPRVRFTFDKYARDQSNVFLADLFSSAGDIIPTLTSAVEKLKDDEAMAPVGELIAQLCEMAKHNSVSAATLAALVRVTGQDLDAGDTEPILDPQRITLTQVHSDALRTTFRQAMIHGHQLSDRERGVLALFVEATSNIEQLLSTYFTLFSAGRPADQKTYLYLVWMLWAFLRIRSAKPSDLAQSIYQELPSIGGDVVTFNYTNFFSPVMVERAKFFHGRLDQYLRIDDRQVISDDPALLKATDVASIASFLETLRMDVTDPGAIDLPAIVPPTSFKPVMSRQQLRTWAAVDDILQQASLLVIVGYSFASADEHFNDLLRQSNPRSRVLIVNPDLELPLRNACRVLRIDRASLKTSILDGYERRESGRLIYVAARGEYVNSAFIDAMSN